MTASMDQTNHEYDQGVAQREASRRYITVATRDGRAVEAYLYSHTGFTEHRVEQDGRTYFILLTNADLDSRADYLANYQADRLNSGLHAAKVHDTLADAQSWMHETFGVTL